MNMKTTAKSEDKELISLSLSGDKLALENLIKKH